MTDHVKSENAEVVVISAAIEAQIAELESLEYRQVFLQNTGCGVGTNNCCELLPPLDLITYSRQGKRGEGWQY